jgi:hypothetical protein
LASDLLGVDVRVMICAANGETAIASPLVPVLARELAVVGGCFADTLSSSGDHVYR